MKYSLLLLLLLSTQVAWSQKTPTYQQLAKLVNPPGTIFIQDSLFMDEAEVANIHWLEYMHSLQKDSVATRYQAALPDTTAWGQSALNDPYGAHYLRAVEFQFFPVVGISRAQAADYCRWRSRKVNEQLHAAPYLRQHPKLRSYRFRVVYRLPTKPEWEAAAGRLLAASPHTRPQPLGFRCAATVYISPK